MAKFFTRNDAYLSRMPVAIIRSWYQREGYIKSMADLIENELQKFSEPQEVSSFPFLYHFQSLISVI